MLWFRWLAQSRVAASVAAAIAAQGQYRVALIDGREFEFAAVPLPDGNALFAEEIAGYLMERGLAGRSAG